MKKDTESRFLTWCRQKDRRYERQLARTDLPENKRAMLEKLRRELNAVHLGKLLVK
jgi:hypothetical protein